MKYALALTLRVSLVVASVAMIYLMVNDQMRWRNKPAAAHEFQHVPSARATPKPLDDNTRARIVKYGLAVRDLTGLPDSHIVDFIEARTGADRQAIIDRLERLKGRLDRDADSLVAERIGIIVANADAARVRDAIVAGLCRPLSDEGDAAALALCQSRQADSTSMRLCRVSNGAHVAVGSRMALTSWRVADVRAALLALAPAPNMVIVRNDDGQAAWEAALAGNVPPLRSCNEGE